jgi:lipopolysaccharide transport system ATP-binding protein
MEYFLQTTNLSKVFDRPFTKQSFASLFSGRLRRRLSIPVFADVSLTIRPGTCTHINGKNGAGKTTLLKILCGIYTQTSGTVSLRGSCCPLLIAGPMMYGNLEVQKNIEHFLKVSGMRPKEAQQSANSILEMLHLLSKADYLLSHLSRGELCAVTLLAGLATKHDLYVIDELMDPLSPAYLSIIAARISEQINAGASFVFTTHNDNIAAQLGAEKVSIGEQSEKTI